MPSRFAEPDYQLQWPRSLFVAEAEKLLSRRDQSDWDERCALLLEHAFVSDYEGGPSSEFREVPVGVDTSTTWAPWDNVPEPPEGSLRQKFLRDLMNEADQLAEDGSHRRPYWRERKAGQRAVAVLDRPAVVREFISLVGEFEEAGYFEKRFGKDCVDDPRDYSAGPLLHRELGVEGLWPLRPNLLTKDIDLFFDVIEFLHDQVARPTSRYFHSFSGCGWHNETFEVKPGRVAYRWRVNKFLERSDLGLRLADEGEDVGRLVTVADDARADLVQAVVARDDGGPADQVRHALTLFRARGADRNQKRSAVVALALVLEERRYNVLEEALSKKDSGALFHIANGFHIRHQKADQKPDYDDFYLDWIFWLYLASIELTNRIIDKQAPPPSRGAEPPF
jgi:hypothetical protein